MHKVQSLSSHVSLLMNSHMSEGTFDQYILFLPPQHAHVLILICTVDYQQCNLFLRAARQPMPFSHDRLLLWDTSMVISGTLSGWHRLGSEPRAHTLNSSFPSQSPNVGVPQCLQIVLIKLQSVHFVSSPKDNMASNSWNDLLQLSSHGGEHLCNSQGHIQRKGNEEMN